MREHWAEKFSPARLRKLRRRLGLSQKDVAARLGIPYINVVNWENGLHTPRVATLVDLARVLHVGIDELVDLRVRNLASLRISKGWNQADVAAELGCSHTWYSRIERGLVRVDQATLRKLARIFRVKPDELATLLGASTARREGRRRGS